MNRPVDPIREYFDTEATRYVRQRYAVTSCEQFAYQARRRLALDLLGNGPGRVIDVGSGPGVLTADLQRKGYEVYAVDVALEMLRESRRGETSELGRPRLIQGRLPDLPFTGASFDAAMSIGVLAYLDDPLAGLREIRRVLKVGGVAIVQVSNALCPTSRLHSFLRRWYRRGAQVLGGPRYPHLELPLTQFRLGTLRRALRVADLDVESVAFYDFQPPLLQWVSPGIALTLTRWFQRFEYSKAMRLLGEGIMLRARAR